MPAPERAVFTEGPIASTLIKLTIPMTFGMVGIVAFNLVDTYFVGRLGTDELEGSRAKGWLKRWCWAWATSS